MQSLAVLREAKACGVHTKSSIMLGLGESDDEIIDTMLDLRDAGAALSWIHWGVGVRLWGLEGAG